MMPEFAQKEWDEICTGIESGTRPMTRDVMICLLVYYMTFSPFESEQLHNLNVNWWLNLSTPDWVDVLLDIMLNPMEEWLLSTGDWDYEVSMYLGELLKRHPMPGIQHSAQLLLSGNKWIVIVDALGQAGHPEALQYLAPYVQEADAFADTNLISLVDTIGMIGSVEAVRLLSSMRQLVPDRDTEFGSLHKLINAYIEDARFRLLPCGADSQSC